LTVNAKWIRLLVLTFSI